MFVVLLQSISVAHIYSKLTRRSMLFVIKKGGEGFNDWGGQGLVKYVPGGGYFRAVPSQNGDKYVTSPPPSNR